MIFVALGSNRPGTWGTPESTLKQAVLELAKPPGTTILALSSLYATSGAGPGRPGVFVNAVAGLECHCSPAALLRRIKAIERRAGPRSACRWGPRTLDLDILDYRGLVAGWPEQGRLTNMAIRKNLIIPHPLLHVRPFVLQPLVEIAPDWRHPVLRRSARELWLRVRDQRNGRIFKRLGALCYPRRDDPLALASKSA